MLKTIICVENYVETACWKFQHVLNTVTHAESHVKTSRCVENVYVRHVENHIENHVEVRKKTITLYETCRNWVADFVFLLQFCTSYWSETYKIDKYFYCKKCFIFPKTVLYFSEKVLYFAVYFHQIVHCSHGATAMDYCVWHCTSIGCILILCNCDVQFIQNLWIAVAQCEQFHKIACKKCSRIQKEWHCVNEP